jgi:hypothetical protein
MADDFIKDFELPEDELEIQLLPTDDEGNIEVVFSNPDEEEDLEPNIDSNEHDANLAVFLEEETLGRISQFCQDRYNDDLSSNGEFFDGINLGLEKLGLTIEELDEPFPGASPITHPLILESALKTQAKIMGEIFSGKGLVDTYLITETNEETIQSSNRVRNYMDYQYLYQMNEFVPDTEKLSFRYALTGNAYRKYYFDPIQNRPRTKYLTEDKFIINSDASTVADTDFHTELFTLDRHEFEHLGELGEYVNVDEYEYGEGFSLDNDIVSSVANVGNASPTKVDSEIVIEGTGDAMGHSSTFSKFQIREHHCYLKLPAPYDEGLSRALPYIVAIEDSRNKILSIRRNWKETDNKKLKRTWYAHYQLIPGLGFHGMGYIHILGNFQFALTSILRSLIDSGQFSNLQGGFRAKGVRFTRDSQMPIRFGEFREIDTGTKNIKDVLMPLDFKEPSQVLERIAQFLDGRAQKFADTTEQVLADSTNYGPVGTTVALLEASTKFTSGILKRFYNGLKQEFQILHDLNFDVLDETQDFFLKGQSFSVRKEDFSGKVDLMPAADPNLSSSAHRIAVAQTKLAAAQQAPDIHNLRAAYTEFYSQIGMEPEEIDRLLPPPAEAQPLDPLSDIVALSQGKPVKAFEGQDHEAHISFKQAFLEDPKGGAQPLAASIIPLLQANIAEHAMFAYVRDIGGQLQLNGGQTGEKALADAAIQIKQFHESQAFEEALASKDPAAMLAQSELENAQTRREELAHDKEKDFAKLAIEGRKLDLKAVEMLQDSSDVADKIKADMAKTRFMKSADMIKDALSGLGTPNKVDITNKK